MDLLELYEHAPCGYLSTDPNGKIIGVNETLCRWLGHTKDGLIGRYVVELLDVPGRIYHDTHFAPLLAMQGEVHDIALELIRVDRPKLPTIASAIARRDASGAIVRHLITFFDCTQRRLYERGLLEERRRAERAAASRDTLLSMLSHDVRSPLSNILMAAQLIEKADDADARKRYLHMIQRAGHSVLELVNAILEHSKLESGTAQWGQVSVDLPALVEELGAIFEVMGEAKGLRFEANVDPRVPTFVSSDRFRLGQILTNLTSNAMKFTPRGKVGLDIRRLESTGAAIPIEFAVSDTGIGISEERQRAIFEDFGQASDDIGARYGGTGLGLSICRRLLELANSELRLESAPDEGSTFSFVLDMHIAPEPAAT